MTLMALVLFFALKYRQAKRKFKRLRFVLVVCDCLNYKLAIGSLQ